MTLNPGNDMLLKSQMTCFLCFLAAEMMFLYLFFTRTSPVNQYRSKLLAGKQAALQKRGPRGSAAPVKQTPTADHSPFSLCGSMSQSIGGSTVPGGAVKSVESVISELTIAIADQVLVKRRVRFAPGGTAPECEGCWSHALRVTLSTPPARKGFCGELHLGSMPSGLPLKGCGKP